MSKPDDDRPGEGDQRRLYARLRPDESHEEFKDRFRDGVLAMIAEHRREHPELFVDGSDDGSNGEGN